MFIFGRREKEIKTGKISNVTCMTCSEITTMHYSVEAKYFHLYWIPMFPYKKTTHIECDTCGDIFLKKWVSENIKNKLKRENELKSDRIPIWMFSGLIILLVLIPLTIFQSSRSVLKKENYVKNPKVGDVYLLDYDSEKYTTMKIVTIEKNSVRFVLNDTFVTKFTKIFSINDDSYYSNKMKSFSKSELNKLYTKDYIYSIDRD